MRYRSPKEMFFFRKPVSWRIKFEPKDLWVGVFWDKRISGNHVYVCPFPTLLIHFLFADARPRPGDWYMGDEGPVQILECGWTVLSSKCANGTVREQELEKFMREHDHRPDLLVPPDPAPLFLLDTPGEGVARHSVLINADTLSEAEQIVEYDLPIDIETGAVWSWSGKRVWSRIQSSGSERFSDYFAADPNGPSSYKGQRGRWRDTRAWGACESEAEGAIRFWEFEAVFPGSGSE